MAMQRGRMEMEWGQTAALLAMTANANRDPKKRPQPFMPDDFNPMAARKKKAVSIIEDSPLGFSMMRRAFCQPKRRD
jgi:hypothetical protein